MINTKNILITGARSPIAIELARSFTKKGCNVILADSLFFAIGRWTNAKTKYVKLPSARFEIDNYIKSIIKLISEYSITDLIPCCEEVFYISKNTNQIPCKVWTSEIEKMQLLHNKESFANNFNVQLNIPVTISVENFNDWSITNKYVFKPKYSRFAGNIFNGVIITRDKLKNPEKWIAQKKIIGKEICIYSIWNYGEMLGYVCYEPVYRAGKGAGIYFKFIENKEVESMVKSFGKNINYTGQLSFDVIIEDNIPWFIECNPRGTSGAHLINKQLAHCFFNNKTTSYINKNQDYMLGSILFFTKPLVFLNKKTILAKDVIFKIKDPFPAIMQWLSFLEIIYIKLNKGTSLLQATTYDIEWNGDES